MLGKLRLYYVLKGKEEEICTIVSKYEHATEYINASHKLDHSSHFVAWCNLRELNFKDPLSWSKYLSIVQPKMEKYQIRSITYNAAEVAELLRISKGCMAIGTSFDTKMERELAMKFIMSEMAKRKETKVN